MKKITKLLFTAFASASMFLAGCSMLGDATVSDSNSEKTPEVKLTTLTGRVSNLKDYDSTVRSIIPVADTKAYDYYIKGKTITGKDFVDPDDTTKKFKKLSYGDGTNGENIVPDADGIPTFTLSIETAAWELTLCAVPSGTSNISEANMVESSALVAYAFADLTKSTDAVMFTLSPDNLTGNGNIALTLYLSNDSAIGDKVTNALWELPADYTCEYQIQNLITGDVIKWSEAGGTDAKEDNLSFSDPGTGADAFGKNSKAGPIGDGHYLKPGTYNFVVMFKHPNLPTSVWSDVLVVLPTKATTQNVFIPNVLGAEPDPVETFTGYIVADSWDLPERPDYYIAHFEWDAWKTLTERYFELELGEIASGSVLASAVTTDELWTANVTDFRAYAAEEGQYEVNGVDKTRVELRKQSEYYDGSLFANNTRCSVYVPLGKVLTARIRAVNNVGNSAWTYVSLPKTYSAIPVAANAKGGQTAPTNYSTNLSSGTGKAPLPFNSTDAAKIMNKFRVTYDLNGGVYKNNVTTNKVVYGSQADLSARVPVILWAANGSDVELKKTPSAFNCWSTAPVADDDTRIYRAVTVDTPEAPTLGEYGCMISTDGTGENMTFKQSAVDDVKEMRGIVTAAEGATKTAAAIMAKDKGGYIGVENLYLYADYSTSFNGDVTKEDSTADFFLATDWVILRSSSTSSDTVYNTSTAFICGPGKSKASAADAHVESNSLVQVSKAKEEDNDGNVGLTFSIALPCESAADPIEYYVGTKKYTMNDLCKTANVSICVKDAQGGYHFVDKGTLNGGAITFGDFDITTLDSGRYTAYIDMTVNKIGRPITRSVRITLDIVD